MSLWHEFKKGIIDENPIFRIVLGMCPTLAITTAAINGVSMGLATSFVLICSNLFISALRKIVPDNVRIPVYVVVIATFVTITDYVMHAYVPALHAALGIYIPLIVVNCIILGRAEAFAGSNPVVPSIVDGIGMGVGFTFSLIAISSVREIIGAGTIFGFHLFGPNYQPAIMMILPPGGFITMGSLLAIFNYFETRSKTRKVANGSK
jgi:electron transport complex protein RnfE